MDLSITYLYSHNITGRSLNLFVSSTVRPTLGYIVQIMYFDSVNIAVSVFQLYNVNSANFVFQ